MMRESEYMAMFPVEGEDPDVTDKDKQLNEDNSTNPDRNDDDDESKTLIQRLMADEKFQNYFQMTTAAVIFLCTISMAWQTDYPQWSIWPFWNNLVLIYFVIELILRIGDQGWYYFSLCDNKEYFWNYFDFLIVVVCILDQWIVSPLASGGASSGPGLQLVRILRIMRILRIARVFRIFQALKPLNTLATGLLESMWSFVSIAALMFMFTLVFAIFMTDIAGNQANNPGDMFYDDRESIKTYWGQVHRSLYTFFQFLTLDNWSEISRGVFSKIPAMWVVFVLYVFLAAFAMLSLLTGVVADKVSEVSQNQKDSAKESGHAELTEFLDVLKASASDDGSPAKQSITLPVFFRLLNEHEEKLESLGAPVKGHEAEEFWECLDHNGDGYLTWPEFRKGLLRLREETVQPKDMLRIRYASERVGRRLQGGQGEAVTTRKLEEVEEMVRGIDEQIKHLQGEVHGFREFLQHSPPS